MSVSSIQSSASQIATILNANTAATSKVSDPAHDGDGDDGASGPQKSAPAPGLGQTVDKTA